MKAVLVSANEEYGVSEWRISNDAQTIESMEVLDISYATDSSETPTMMAYFKDKLALFERYPGMTRRSCLLWLPTT